MSVTPTTTMRLDEGAKAAARPVLEELGLNISSATNMFLRAVARTGGIPFGLTLGRPLESRDYVAEYLAPIMGERSHVGVKSRKDLASLRKRLGQRRDRMQIGRRMVV